MNAARRKLAIGVGPILIAFLAITFAACQWGLTRKVTYRLQTIANLPVGANATDWSGPFARRFCGTLRHLDPTKQEWGECREWLEAPVDDQPPETEPIPTNLGVMVVSGIFSQCLENQRIFAFQQSLEHLRNLHKIKAHNVCVSGVGSSEANAAEIESFLAINPGNYIAVGYSKGIADLMVAIQDKPLARQRIKVLVSIAGAVSGSRLADLPTTEAVTVFEKVIQRTGLGKCDIQDAGGLRSLTREDRYRFLRRWTPPSDLKAFSVVGVVERKQTSEALQLLRDRVSYYSADQDSQVIADEGILPGARYLGVARGDHWALALPFFETKDPKVLRYVNQNRFPRTALLEAIVREAHQ